MAIKDFFKGLFSKSSGQLQYAKLLNGGYPVFSQFGQNIYVSDIVQNSIDVIATECSKLQPRHVIRDDDGMVTILKGDNLNRLFKFKPNPLMTTKDFIEKVMWQLYPNYNCFIYPMYERSVDKRGNTIINYTAFYPLNPSRVEFLQDETGKLFVKFHFSNGDNFTLAYSDTIHLRKKFSVHDIMGGGLNGQPDNTALLKVLDINDTVMQGLGKAIKTSLSIRGILKINTMLDDDKQKAERERFEAAIESGKTGILTTDLKGDYTPLNIDPKLIDTETLQFLNDKVLNWFGVSMPILCGVYTDNDYQAFYNKTLEPTVISLGQSFSGTIFTQRQQDIGHEMVFYQQRLELMDVKNKLAIMDGLGNRGALTNNQLLALFGMEPYEGGNVRNMSLNFIDVAIANEYQMRRAGIIKEAGGNEGNAGNKE